jgi:hypothetical protein
VGTGIDLDDGQTPQSFVRPTPQPFYLSAQAVDFHESDHRFHLKSISDFTLGDHHRSEATLA